MIRGIGAIVALAAVTVLTWSQATSMGNMPEQRLVSQLVGAVALTGFAAEFFLATRHRVLDTLFGGLDKAYVVHKWLGIAAVSLAVVHFVLMGTSPEGAGHGGGAGGGMGAGHGQGAGAMDRSQWASLGAPSVALFIGLVAIALVANRLRYEIWQTIHKVMIVPYAIGLVHYYGASSYYPFGLSAFSLWMDALTLLGVLSALYAIAGYPWLAFSHRYRVTAVHPLGPRAFEITGEPIGEPLRYKAGQFAFVRFGGLRFPPHPFSLSGAPGEPAVQFAIKAAGDHTLRLRDAVRPGDEFALAGPHGRFYGTRSVAHQLWVAAGVGLAPFRGMWRAGIPDGVRVDLFYTYRGEEGLYLDELAALDGVRVHLVDTTRRGRLSPEEIAAVAEGPVDVYYCGPAALRKALRVGLPRAGVRVARFHAEDFAFGR